MKPWESRRTLLAILTTLAAMQVAGCADGPIPEIRHLNPWVTKQWVADEEFGPTFYKRLEELQKVRASASSISAAERERLSADIAEVYKAEPSAAMRAELIRAMGDLPTATTQNTLTAAAVDSDPDVRILACRGLGRFKNSDAVQKLCEVVGADSNLDVRLAAVKELGNTKEPAATKALAIAIDENDPALQHAAMVSLRGNTGRDFGKDLLAWRTFAQGGEPKPVEPPSIAEQVKRLIYR